MDLPPIQYARAPDGVSIAYAVVGDAEVEYLYDVTAIWTPGVERQVYRYDDPDLAVAWPVTDPVVSEVDAVGMSLRDRFPDHPRWQR